MTRQLDSIGHFIVVLHDLLGHRQAAAFLGQDVGDISRCVLCRYDKGTATRADVLNQIGVPGPDTPNPDTCGETS